MIDHLFLKVSLLYQIINGDSKDMYNVQKNIFLI